MDKNGNSAGLVSAQLRYWQKLSEQQRMSLSYKKRNNLLLSALDSSNLSIAEQVFESLRSDSDDAMTLAVSAQQIANYCRQNNKPNKARRYIELTQQLTQAGMVNFAGAKS